MLSSFSSPQVRLSKTSTVKCIDCHEHLSEVGELHQKQLIPQSGQICKFDRQDAGNDSVELHNEFKLVVFHSSIGNLFHNFALFKAMPLDGILAYQTRSHPFL